MIINSGGQSIGKLLPAAVCPDLRKIWRGHDLQRLQACAANGNTAAIMRKLMYLVNQPGHTPITSTFSTRPLKGACSSTRSYAENTCAAATMHTYPACVRGHGAWGAQTCVQLNAQQPQRAQSRAATCNNSLMLQRSAATGNRGLS